MGQTLPVDESAPHGTKPCQAEVPRGGAVMKPEFLKRGRDRTRSESPPAQRRRRASPPQEPCRLGISDTGAHRAVLPSRLGSACVDMHGPIGLCLLVSLN